MFIITFSFGPAIKFLLTLMVVLIHALTHIVVLIVSFELIFTFIHTHIPAHTHAHIHSVTQTLTQINFLTRAITKSHTLITRIHAHNDVNIFYIFTLILRLYTHEPLILIKDSMLPHKREYHR